MSDPLRIRLLLLLASLALLSSAQPSRAQMTPVADYRELLAHVTDYFGMSEQLEEHPLSPFEAWPDKSLYALVEPPDNAQSDAFAYQVSQFFPAAISGSGNTFGTQYYPSGSYGAASIAHFQFSLDAPVDYFLDGWVQEGDWAGTAEVYLKNRATSEYIYDLDTTG